MNFDSPNTKIPSSTWPPPSPWNVLYRARQVPGDGNCLFHSISLAYIHWKTGRHEDFHLDSGKLRETSSWMRKLSVENMRYPVRSRGGLRGGSAGSVKGTSEPDVYPPSRTKSNNAKLYLQGGQSIPMTELVSSAGMQYNITSDEYLGSMTEDSTWGGGPEIVSLSNALKVPIHVYELCWVNKKHPKLKGGEKNVGRWGVRRMACFGSPKWDRRGCLEILSCDSRFPDVGRKNKEGNHFMYLCRWGGEEQ